MREELPELPVENVILEPTGRNTAPAAALAARSALLRESDPVLVVAPTDHFIGDEAAFADALVAGVAAAEGDCLVTFGIVPDRPATVYGYIEVARHEGAGKPLPVLRFREKPAEAEAAAFLATGRFYWNAGIFAWRARVFEREMAKVSPDIASAIAALAMSAGGKPCVI
jgi:mannose-1-phosphate guanylyltransferase